MWLPARCARYHGTGAKRDTALLQIAQFCVLSPTGRLWPTQEYLPKISVQLCPPKPNVLFMAY